MGEGMIQIAISEHTEDKLRAVNDWILKTGVWLENLSGHDHPLSCIILLMLFFSLFFIELFLRIFYSAGGRCGLEKVALDRQSSQWLCSTSSCVGHGSVRERCCRACDVMMEARGGTRGTLGGLESHGAGHAGSWQENSCNYAVWLRDLSGVENTLLPCYIQTNV